MARSLLAVGYVIRDFVEGREQVGGSPFYSASLARKWELESRIWTSAAEGFPPPGVLSGIQVERTRSPTSTTFAHEYDSVTGVRTSYVKTLASPLDPGTLPASWRKTPLVLLAPNWQEFGPEAVDWFETEALALAPQGWFRRADPQGRFFFARSRWDELPRRVALVVVSEEDLSADPGAWDWIRKSSRVAMITRGRAGHVVAFGNRQIVDRPPYVAEEIDPTGAGDIFATAALIALEEGADPLQAARLGSAAASYVVEKLGIEGLPTREEVLRRSNPTAPVTPTSSYRAGS